MPFGHVHVLDESETYGMYSERSHALLVPHFIVRRHVQASASRTRTRLYLSSALPLSFCEGEVRGIGWIYFFLSRLFR